MLDAFAQLVAPQLRVMHDLGISLLVAFSRLLVAQRRGDGILAKLLVRAALARQVPVRLGASGSVNGDSATTCVISEQDDSRSTDVSQWTGRR
jgi:hypothetical protein